MRIVFLTRREATLIHASLNTAAERSWEAAAEIVYSESPDALEERDAEEMQEEASAMNKLARRFRKGGK